MHYLNQPNTMRAQLNAPQNKKVPHSAREPARASGETILRPRSGEFTTKRRKTHPISPHPLTDHPNRDSTNAALLLCHFK